MAHLLVVSLIWAFSFGLIKGNLQGLDPSFVSWVRMTLSLLVFLPFLRPAQMKWRQAWQLIVLGGVQYGLMYVFYIASFETLKAHQVALSTVLTPLFVVGLEAWTTRTLRARFALAALLAVGGAALLNPDPTSLGAWKGMLLVQGSNLCFAVGQVWYRRLGRGPTPDRSSFALAYAGAVLVTGMAALLTNDSIPSSLTFTQIWTLGYLGFVASGICFFLWNVGAKATNAGVLAVFNNVKIPLAVLVSLLVFGESAQWSRLLSASAMIALALWLGARTSKQASPEKALASVRNDTK